MRINSGFLVILLFFIGSAGNVLAQSHSTLSQQLQSTAKNIISGQINAFKTRNHERAFGYAAPGLQKLFGSTDRFIKMVKSGYGAIYGAQSWSYGRSTLKDGALLQEVMLSGPHGRDWVALYTLKQQADGRWRITSVLIKKSNAVSS